MTASAHIRRRPDGSIDTAHYVTQGRRMRSEAAHGMIAPRRSTRPGGFVLTALTTLVAVFLPGLG